MNFIFLSTLMILFEIKLLTTLHKVIIIIIIILTIKNRLYKHKQNKDDE